MPSEKITCPECDAALTVSEPVAPGKKIRCPKCQAIFRVPETAIEDAALARAPGRDADVEERASARRSRDRDRDDDDRDDEYESRPARRRSREKQGMGVGMMIGIIAASLLLIAAVAFGAYWGISSWHDRQEVARKEAEDALAAKLPPPGPPLNVNQLQKQLEQMNKKQGGGNPLAAAGAGPQVGQAAPEIESEDLDGQKFKLSDYRGKVVLLDFWGHW